MGRRKKVSWRSNVDSPGKWGKAKDTGCESCRRKKSILAQPEGKRVTQTKKESGGGAEGHLMGRVARVRGTGSKTATHLKRNRGSTKAVAKGEGWVVIRKLKRTTQIHRSPRNVSPIIQNTRGKAH